MSNQKGIWQGAVTGKYMLAAAMVVALSACGGGGGGGGGGNDVSLGARFAQVNPDRGNLGANEAIVVQFNKRVNRDSIALSGELAEIDSEIEWEFDEVEDGDVAFITPTNHWPVGNSRKITVRARNTEGENASASADYRVIIKLGSGDGFTELEPIIVGQTSLSATGETLFRGPEGSPALIGDTLYLPDTGNGRILGYDNIPNQTGENQDFALGDLLQPHDAAGNNQRNQLVVAETERNVISAYNPLPEADSATSSVIAGQETAACGQTGLRGPQSVHITPSGKMIVADTQNHRVLIWNSAPEPTDAGSPDFVIGQGNFEACNANRGNDSPSAGSLSRPNGVWSNDEKLVVVDADNKRVLIWNTFPQTNGQAADLVLGQPDLTSAAGDLDAGSFGSIQNPTGGVTSNGLQLFISDAGPARDDEKSRVLVWNDFPTNTRERATGALIPGDEQGGETFLPDGLLVYESGIIVGESGVNNRYLVIPSL